MAKSPKFYDSGTTFFGLKDLKRTINGDGNSKYRDFYYSSYHFILKQLDEINISVRFSDTADHTQTHQNIWHLLLNSILYTS